MGEACFDRPAGCFQDADIRHTKNELNALLTRTPESMKITDDYRAKIRLWALNAKPLEPEPGPVLPRFRPQRFRTHAEMNAWKRELLRQVAAGETTDG